VAYEHENAAYDQRLSLDQLASTYWNDGYGALTLCSSRSNSPYCKQIHAQFAAIDKIYRLPQRPERQLVAAWSRLVSSHIRLIPHLSTGKDGLVSINTSTTIVPFTMQLLDIFPMGYGVDQTPFEIEDAMDIEAEFVLGAATAFSSSSNGTLGANWNGKDEGRKIEILGLGVRGLDFAQERLPAREGWDVYWHKIRPDF
jgi:hypothetical protein